MADSIFQLKWYCSTGVWPRGAQVRARWGRSLSPLSSTKTMVCPCFCAFFKLRPALLLPAPDGHLVPLQRPPRRTLATPAQLPQQSPHVGRMVLDGALAADQFSHATRRPQAGGVSQRFRPLLQPLLQALHIRRTQSRLASGPSGLLQPGATALLQLLRPAAHRLPMHAHAARHLGLVQTLRQQPRRFQPAPLQRCKIPFHSGWISHGREHSRGIQECHYIMQISLGGPPGILCAQGRTARERKVSPCWSGRSRFFV